MILFTPWTRFCFTIKSAHRLLSNMMYVCFLCTSRVNHFSYTLFYTLCLWWLLIGNWCKRQRMMINKRSYSAGGKSIALITISVASGKGSSILSLWPPSFHHHVSRVTVKPTLNWTSSYGWAEKGGPILCDGGGLSLIGQDISIVGRLKRKKKHYLSVLRKEDRLLLLCVPAWGGDGRKILHQKEFLARRIYCICFVFEYVCVCAPDCSIQFHIFRHAVWVLLQHFHFTEVSEPHQYHHHNSVPAERFLIVLLLLLFSLSLLLFHAHHIVRMWNINTFSLGAVWL